MFAAAMGRGAGSLLALSAAELGAQPVVWSRGKVEPLVLLCGVSVLKRRHLPRSRARDDALQGGVYDKPVDLASVEPGLQTQVVCVVPAADVNVFSLGPSDQQDSDARFLRVDNPVYLNARRAPLWALNDDSNKWMPDDRQRCVEVEDVSMV
ncbi:MAG: hypothetical protein CMQ40_01785 [Gammaproteobacteria bacterium]|nr:hypothetical protein [Gammaproteobacteria bacterium]